MSPAAGGNHAVVVVEYLKVRDGKEIVEGDSEV